MIVQACINGARPAEFHPDLPLSITSMVQDSLACISAGASEIHLHPRSPDGRETLSEVSTTVRAMRHACPGTSFGVSTGLWIEGDAQVTCERIRQWSDLPDFASVNLAEPGALSVMDALLEKGVGIEAGLASPHDAELLLAYDRRHRVMRILIEIGEQDQAEAQQAFEATLQILQAGDLKKPILLHGFDSTVWSFVELACGLRFSTRVGLEDTKFLPDGKLAKNNAELVSRAIQVYRANWRQPA